MDMIFGETRMKVTLVILAAWVRVINILESPNIVVISFDEVQGEGDIRNEVLCGGEKYRWRRLLGFWVLNY